MDEVYFNQASGFRLGSRSKESNFRAYITEGRGQKLHLSHLMFFFENLSSLFPKKHQHIFLLWAFEQYFNEMWYDIISSKYYRFS